jgi:hypothetical protein
MRFRANSLHFFDGIATFAVLLIMNSETMRLIQVEPFDAISNHSRFASLLIPEVHFSKEECCVQAVVFQAHGSETMQ